MKTREYQVNNWRKNIAYLLSSQAISMIGTMLVQYAIIWHVTLSTNSGLMTGLVTSVGLLPMVIVMPFAGALADRYNRKKISIISDSVIALVSLLAAIALLLANNLESNMFLLVGLTFIRSVGQGFQTPAVSAILPQLTPKDSLVRINGIDQTIQAGMMLASPALAATLLNFLPLAFILLIDFITAIIGVSIMLTKVNVPNLKRKKNSQINIIDDIKSGLTYLNAHKVLVALIVAGFIGSVLATPASNLAPLQITREFNDGLWQLSASEIGFAGGMLIGGVIMSVWGGLIDKIKTVALGYALLVIPFLTLGITSHFWIYFLMMVTIGLVVPISRTAMVSFFQTATDNSHMGRVMSIVTMTISFASPVTILIIGPLADVISINLIMIAAGILLIPLVIWLLSGKYFKV
ncbi:MFS transporter [Enterococcus sp. AZ103]|uniref:MFS transporter n=1 Tax=Enterococcus sp. AZ103 TaxID=2774628 RepID=UPI003F228C24